MPELVKKSCPTDCLGKRKKEYKLYWEFCPMCGEILDAEYK